MDATHGTNLAKLEARLTQTDLHLDEAIGMADAAESQGVWANLQLGDLNEKPLVKLSYLI